MIVTYDKDRSVLIDETYVRRWGLSKVNRGKGQHDHKPGLKVVHFDDDQSSGIVVAVTDKGITVLWSKPPIFDDTVSSKMFKTIITSVQPMTLPPGDLFYLDYQYGSEDDDQDG